MSKPSCQSGPTEALYPEEPNPTSQALLAAIVESSDDAIISKNLDGIILSWNAAATRLFGYTAEEAIGRSITMLIPPEYQHEEPVVLARLRSGQRIDHYETIRMRKDGTRFFISLSVSPVRNSQGRIVAAAKIVRDITEQRRTAIRMQQLQRITATLASLLTPAEVARIAAQEGALGAGANAGIVGLRNSGAREQQYDIAVAHPATAAPSSGLEEVIGQPLCTEEAPRMREPVLLDASEYRRSFPVLARGADLRGVQAAAVCPLATGERTYGIVIFEFGREYRVTSDDLEFLEMLSTQSAQALERAVLFAAEREARTEAEHSNRAKTDFLAVMSHELRTPLNAIAGYSELLEMQVHGSLNDKQLRYIRNIQRSQRSLLGLINDILQFAKVEAGRLELRPEKVDLDHFLRELAPLIIPQVQAKEMRYEYPGCSPSLAVHADRDRLQQILLNLLSNAVKFTAPGGKISIEVEEQDESAVVVRVRDNGAGIAPEDLDRVFDPFVQPNRNLASEHVGTGLGLAISRDLARAMGGMLTVESKLGEGSVFSLRLPRSEAAEEARQTS